MIEEIVSVINEMKQFFLISISDIEVCEYEDSTVINIDYFLEIEVYNNSDFFDITLTTGAPDFYNENIEEVKRCKNDQEKLIIISQYLYEKTKRIPEFETTFLGVCEFPDHLLYFRRLELTLERIEYYIKLMSDALNYLMAGDLCYLDDFNEEELLSKGLRFFSEEANYYRQLKELLNDLIKVKYNVGSNELDFSNKVFKTVHDFIYYARQHPNVLTHLQEEQIRDLCLIPLKSNFNFSEGEVFNYDGKLDFKIINPENKYEFISGEFKWWRGQKSIEEAFHQAIRKHSTGQEKEIYIIILSKNKDIDNVISQVLKSVKSEEELIEEYEEKKIAPKGSKEFILESLVKIRDNTMPLKICVADLYYENI